MLPMTEKELSIARTFWYRNYVHKLVDREIEPYLNAEMHGYPFKQQIKQQSWLRKARQSLFLTVSALAEKLKISQSAYTNYEQCEENGTIRLKTLALAAEAMDCELVYAIRPKNKELFSNRVWKTLLIPTLRHPLLLVCDQKQRGWALAGLTTKLMRDPKFRRSQSWSRTANQLLDGD